MTDRYEIETNDHIGTGAYGSVYKCRISRAFYDFLKSKHVALPIDCQTTLFAVKLQTYDALFCQQISLLREIDVLMRTKNYPGTVEIFDFWLEPQSEHAFLILKLAAMSLDDYIENEADPLKRIQYLPFFLSQMLLHLAYLKHNSIAHRDVKPQNILIQNAPNIFGWTIEKSRIEKKENVEMLFRGTCCSIEKLSIADTTNPVQQMCRFFLPMAHNCFCFTSDIEPDETSFVCPRIVTSTSSTNEYSIHEDDNDSVSKRHCQRNASSASTKGIPIRRKNSATKKIDGVGSAPTKNPFDYIESFSIPEDLLDSSATERIARQSKSAPFAQLCDFGLSKHINKAHHSPFIVTPNFRSPELFDPTAFYEQPYAATTATTTYHDDDQMEHATGNYARLKASFQESQSQSDPNDVSLKRVEDLPYNENIDVWGLGCTVAQLVTGCTLFPGKDMTSVLTALKSLLTESSTDELSPRPSVEFDEQSHDGAASTMQFDIRPTPEKKSLRFSLSASNTNVQQPVVWIDSVVKRSQKIRQKLYLQLVHRKLLSSTEIVAQRICDTLGNDFFDLLAQLLDPNPHTRPDAEQLLTHRYVQPYIQPSLLLIYSIAFEKSKFVPIEKTIRSDIDYHWWAFQHGLRAGAFQKDQLLIFHSNDDLQRELILEYRRVIFAWMLCVVRLTKCRYETFFSALYNFDRCVANFPRNDVQQSLLNFDTYRLLALCCLYLVLRYYERIYVSLEQLIEHIKINTELEDGQRANDVGMNVTKQQIERYMVLFLDTVCGQITIPSPWHFVLHAFKQLCSYRQSEFATIQQYQHILTLLFGQNGSEKSIRVQRPTSRRKPSASAASSSLTEREQLLLQLSHIRRENNESMAQHFRSETRASTLIYTSHFKKHCSRLLFFVMQQHDLAYVHYNNRALGTALFRRGLFNALFCGAFSRIKLRQTIVFGTFQTISKTSLVRAKK